MSDDPERRRAAKLARRLANQAAWREKTEANRAAARKRKKDAPPPPDRDDIPKPEVLGYEYYSDFSQFEEFCRDCLVIITKQGKKAPFVLNTSQKIVLAEIRKLIAAGIPPRLIILKSRQVGISTLVEAILTWRCITRSNISSLVLAHTLKSSKSLFRMSRNYHRFFSGQLKQATRIQNVHEIEYDSGSRLQVEVQGEARSYTAQLVHLSEFAFFLQAVVTLTAVMQTVPMDTSSLVVIESTANGVAGQGKKFHDMWVRAVGLADDDTVADDEKGWTPIFIPWFRHEEYVIQLRHGEKFTRTSAEEKLCADHPEITNEKLKWRRWCITTNLDGDEELFAQEYPATWQEAFALTGRPAFDAEAVIYYTNELARVRAEKLLPARSEIDSDPPLAGPVVIVPHDRGRLRIFSEPESRHTYIVGADPSEGDPGSDPSPLAVLDDQTMNVAATWYGKAPPDVLACYAIDLARYYNDALIINEANNHGILFHETVIQFGYPNLYYRKVSDESVAGEVSEKPGFMSTRRTREHLFNTLRKYVRMKMGRIWCPHMIQQIQTAVYQDDKIQAGVGMEKDLLVAFGLTLMAHRGSMNNPLEPHSETTIRTVAEGAALLKEREGMEVAEQFVMVETGMTMDEVLKMQDAILERDARRRRQGIGGLR
jgi:hypothetical protein